MSQPFTTFQSRLKNKEALIVILAINVAIFLLFSVINIFINLSNGSVWALSLFSFFEKIFFFNTDPSYFLIHPWTLVTSIFTHVSLMHILFNMLIFYFAAEMFVYFFGSRKLVWIYLLGGIVGNLLEFIIQILLNSSFSISIIGASGSVMAVFVAVAVFKPDLKVKLFGVFDVKIIYLAAFYFLIDFVNLGANDGVAHFAHLGGALVGFMSAKQKNSSKDFLQQLDTYWKKLTTRKKGMGRPIYHQQPKRPMTDEQYNARKHEQQEKMDAILDKISKHGYDGLTAGEKAFLFEQSHKK